MSLLTEFRKDLEAQGIEGIRDGLIGRDARIETEFGPRRMIYADYVASGRGLAQVEDLIRDRVLPYYANSHTEASYCGAFMTRLREAARAEVLRLTGGDQGCHAIFTGSGATSGINRIVGLLRLSERVRAGEDIVVIVGPYEHHSNLLPWRETGARMIEMPEATGHGVDLEALRSSLEDAGDADLVVGAFSAASNVTGLVTDPDPVTRLLKAHGALAVWDYAGGAPYLPIDMSPSPDCRKDAVVLSPHKFPGGPGASGLLILRDTMVQSTRPSQPGGGTVKFVSPWAHDYLSRVEAREEAGTPNVLGDIRAALALIVKDVVGEEQILERDKQLRARAIAAWSDEPQLCLLGRPDAADTLPILSFTVRDRWGARVHHQLFTRMLSDFHGIQARGGCACAGPYAHRLLDIDATESEKLRLAIREGRELDKPGWVRLNLSYLHTEAEVEAILSGVRDLLARMDDLMPLYDCDSRTARFSVRASA